MPVIVDAYNVLHVVGILPPDLAGPDLADLMGLIAHSRFTHRGVTLICDGVPAPGATPIRKGPVRVRYAGLRARGMSADEMMIGMIHKSSAPRRLQVVTSDRAILREARKRRCLMLSSEDFLRLLAQDAEMAPPNEKIEINQPSQPPSDATAPDERRRKAAETARKSQYLDAVPGDLVAEAERIAEELEQEAAEEHKRIQHAIQQQEEERRQAKAQLAAKKKADKKSRSLDRFLSEQMIDDAQRMVGESADISPDLSLESDSDPTGAPLPPLPPFPHENEPGSDTGASKRTFSGSGGGILPRDILEEAERLLREEGLE